MDINLDTLKSEILEYLETSGFAVFRSTSGGLEGLPLVMWDSERYPAYRMFLETAKTTGAKLILFASREFEQGELEDAFEELQETQLDSQDRRELERRLREFRSFEGVTCSLELAFDHSGRMYVYEVRPDWYDEFLNVCDEIAAALPEEDDAPDDGSYGGFFSRN